MYRYVTILLLILTVDSLQAQNAKPQVADSVKLVAYPRYPKQAVEKKIQGIVKVRVYFDQNCRISDAVVIEGLGYGCDEESIRYVKLNHLFFEAKEKAKQPPTTRDLCEVHSTDIPIRFDIIEDQ